MNDVTQPTQSKSSKLPVAALLLSILPCTAIIGLILGIVALVRIGKNPAALGGKGIAIAAVAIPLVMGPITAAIAIPNFVRFGCRSKQSEAKVTLKALHASELRHQSEKGAFTADLAAMSFAPGGVTVRYDYRVVKADAASYQAEAVAREPALSGDKWVVDERGDPQNVVDGCR